MQWMVANDEWNHAEQDFEAFANDYLDIEAQ